MVQPCSLYRPFMAEVGVTVGEVTTMAATLDCSIVSNEMGVSHHFS